MGRQDKSSRPPTKKMVQMKMSTTKRQHGKNNKTTIVFCVVCVQASVVMLCRCMCAQMCECDTCDASYTLYTYGCVHTCTRTIIVGWRRNDGCTVMLAVRTAKCMPPAKLNCTHEVITYKTKSMGGLRAGNVLSLHESATPLNPKWQQEPFL